MVKLPQEQDISECDSVMFYYNNHRVYTHRPIGLLDLERIAAMAVNYSFIGVLSVYLGYPPYHDVQQMAMNRVREIFNMEFKMVCDSCGTTHYQDEITAPER